MTKPRPYRGDTADAFDPHRSWTAQSDKPFPKEDQRGNRRVHPAELPDSDVVEDAGFKPQPIPEWYTDEETETQPPSGSYPVDHPDREKYRYHGEDEDELVEDSNEEDSQPALTTADQVAPAASQ